MKACILTPWAGKGVEEDPYRPLVADLYEMTWADVTGQPAEHIPPDPNLYAIEAVCSAATLAEIEADSRFLVLWSD